MSKKLILLALLLLVIIGCGGDSRPQELNVYTWANYVSDELKTGFENEFGVRVNVSVFSSNEDLHTRLQSGVTGYDIVMPSDYTVEILIKEGLLEALNWANIPNEKNISPQFKGKYFDPENRYSVPYTWGTAGIGYDSAKVESPPESWAALWDEQYRGKISMLNDQRETLGATLKLLGYSVNTKDSAELDAAKKRLMEQKSLVQQYKNEADEILSAGDVVIAHCWSGDAFRAAETRPTIKYIIPKEGSTQFIDTICIPKSAKNRDLAEKFINYLLRPEVNAKITEYTKYGTCVTEAKNHVNASLRDESGIYPPDAVMQKLESIIDLGEMTPVYNRAWEEIKAK